MLFGKNKKRTFVLGIDGFPYSFLQDRFIQENMPKLSSFTKQNLTKRMDSVYPVVSSVAWTSFATGQNPAEHNIFGFVDRTPNPFQITIPTARERRAKTIWQEFSAQGKKVIVINVPLTYPPEQVNGILTSCFLCTDINKSTYPADFSGYLKEKNYIIDVDAGLAKENKRKLMDELFLATDKRFEIALELFKNKEWDYFQLHIMETDRLFHFFWNDLEMQGEYYPDIIKFLAKLDTHIDELQNKLNDEDRFIMLSDHGFCGINYEVQLNAWLKQQGLLKFTNGSTKLPEYHKDTVCYSLLPGRIFINLEGREEKGTVKKSEYQNIRKDIKNRLLNFTDPATNENIIDRVFFREEIYSGPYLDNAADIIAHPKRGYDLKGRTEKTDIFEKSHLNGMHTYDDAFIYAKNCDISKIKSIMDVKKAILTN
ncbi:MAG: alkaline phosphatase family protein [Candidatus Omnitrophota bacterium]|nr:alkaline phosphatase family protein [Candidatus Omnitrophota bacterium]